MPEDGAIREGDGKLYLNGAWVPLEVYEAVNRLPPPGFSRKSLMLSTEDSTGHAEVAMTLHLEEAGVEWTETYLLRGQRQAEVVGAEQLENNPNVQAVTLRKVTLKFGKPVELA